MSPCSKISACGLALLPPPSTSGHLMGAWGHRSQFFCAPHVATVLSTFGLHCTLYTIPVPGQVGLWQRPGTWAWLALLCLARPCIHFSSWSAACLWLRKQTSTVFYLPRGLQRVAMSSLLFFFFHIEDSLTQLSQPRCSSRGRGACCLIVMISSLPLSAWKREWAMGSCGGFVSISLLTPSSVTWWSWETLTPSPAYCWDGSVHTISPMESSHTPESSSWGLDCPLLESHDSVSISSSLPSRSD